MAEAGRSGGPRARACLQIPRGNRSAHELQRLPPLMNADAHLDLEKIRADLEGARGREYWRSLDEIARTPEFEEFLHREFPAGASEWENDLSRRRFFQIMAASFALAGLNA